MRLDRFLRGEDMATKICCLVPSIADNRDFIICHVILMLVLYFFYFFAEFLSGHTKEQFVGRGI